MIITINIFLFIFFMIFHRTNNPVEMWAKEQVGNWLLALNMEMYIPRWIIIITIMIIIITIISQHGDVHS